MTIFNYMGKNFKCAHTKTLRYITKPSEINFLNKTIDSVPNKGTVVQAGGHVGLYPWLLSQSFERVISFELTPESFNYMQQNLSDTKIEIHNCGLGAKEGTAGFFVANAQNTGGNSLVEGGGNINVTTIDSMDLNACDLIFLDIEGYELHALKGAEETIKKHKPRIVIEFNIRADEFGITWEDLNGYIISLGYELDFNIVTNFCYKPI